MKTICKFCIAILFYFAGITPIFSQCDFDNLFGEFDITDGLDTCLTITFSDVLNDDLSLNTIFNGIQLEFEHDAVSDLVIDLTSPAGQSITIVGDVANGSITFGTDWNVLFTECSGGASPDSGFPAIWDNAENWVIGGNYTGIYYPAGGCFEDFNIGSVNGTWTLCIRDLIPFNSGHITRIGFVLNGVTTQNCNQCIAEAGDMTINDVVICTNEDRIIDFGIEGENVDPDYEIIYLVSQNNDLVTINLDSNFIALAPGLYDVCAASIKSEDLISFLSAGLTYQEIIDGINDNNISFCIDLADNCSTVEIRQAPSTLQMERTICQGENITIGTETFNTTGTYSALLPRGGSDLCDTSVILNLEVISIMPAIVASSFEINCNNTTIALDGSTSLQEFGSDFFWSTPNGLVVGDPTQVSIEINQPGTYFLNQTENGCTRQASVDITIDSDLPQILITSLPLTCLQDQVALTVTSSAVITSASWQGPAGFTSSSIQPLVSTAGRYDVVFTDITGCQIPAFFDVEQGPDLPIIAASASNLSCTSSSVQINVSNTSFLTYRWTGPKGFVSNVAEPIVTNPGSYYLEIHDVVGCKGFTSIDILGDIGTFDYEVTGENFVCNGGAVTISATSEASNAVYKWTGPNNFFSSSPINSVRDEGTYYVEIIANGCYVRDSIVLTRDISDLPEYEVIVENIGDCINPSWRFTAVPIANEFQTSLVRWGISGVGIIGNGISMDVNAAGRYFLYVNTFNGCAVVKVFTVDPLPGSPDISLVSKSHVSCATGQNSGILGVTENADYTYEWQSSTYPGFSADSSTIENLDAGYYELTVTDVNTGCITLYNDRILADTIPRITSVRNTNIDCNNPTADIILAANGGGNTYDWSGPEGAFTTQNITVSTPGQYIVTVTGGNGCITLDTANIIQDTDPPSFILNDLELECESQSALLDPQTTDAGVIFNWSGPSDFTSSSSTNVVFNAGLYQVTLTGSNGCTAEAQVDVIENPDTPVPVASVLDTLNCIRTELTIFSEATVPVVSYFWDGPGAFTSVEQNPTVTTPGEYIVTIESTQGCIGFDTIQVIEVIIPPDINYAFDPAVDCVDNTAQLNGLSIDPGAIYSWSGPNGYDTTGQMVEAVDTGIYIYQIRGSNNCIASDTFLISAEHLSFNSSNTTNCFHPGIDISELSSALSYNITWTGPNGFSSVNESPTPDENGVYIANVNGSNGCSATVSVQVELDTISPNIGTQQIGTIRCEETIISLSADGSSVGDQFHYNWTSNDGIILNGADSSIAQIDGVGNYTLMVLDSLNGCSSRLVTLIEEAPAAFIDIEIDTENPRCFGENNGSAIFIDDIGGTGPFTYSLDGIIFSDDPLIGDLPPGNYTFTAKDSFGCVVEESFTISETDALELDLGENIDVFLGNEVEINATTNLSMDQIESIRWQIENQLGCADCLSFTLTPEKDLLIELTLMNEKGCTVTDQVKVRVDQEPVLYKPNIFSPNDDGFNDIFFISSNPGVGQIKSLAIFDRWGNRVFSNVNFEPGDISAGWDGRFQGQVLQAGVYIYKLEVEMINGFQRTIEGEVTLFK